MFTGKRLLIDVIPLGLVASMLALAPLRAEAAPPAADERLVWDLGNALLWTGSGLGIRYGADPETRWDATLGFERDLRDDVRGGSTSARDRADEASDVMLGISAGLLPLAGIYYTSVRGDEREAARREALEMSVRAAEAMSLTFFITEASKDFFGRERPFGQDCDARSPPSGCDGENRNKSFFSGHSSLAATGAGLTCAHSLEREIWGSGRLQRIVPCALGVGSAIATGVLRMEADKHWLTDVVVGLTVGGLVGYFDTWGPLDLLRFRTRGEDPVIGAVLPYADGESYGARLALHF